MRAATTFVGKLSSMPQTNVVDNTYHVDHLRGRSKSTRVSSCRRCFRTTHPLLEDCFSHLPSNCGLMLPLLSLLLHWVTPCRCCLLACAHAHFIARFMACLICCLLFGVVLFNLVLQLLLRQCRSQLLSAACCALLLAVVCCSSVLSVANRMTEQHNPSGSSLRWNMCGPLL